MPPSARAQADVRYVAKVKAEPLDPRNTFWEKNDPAYRVYFWHRQSDRPMAGWVSDEWRLSNVDVAEVLAWAKEQAGGRRVTIWVEHDDDRDGRGMIRLLGWEPTRSDSPPPWTS
jgi:hypothetical protein